MQTIQLRDYQHECIESVYTFWQKHPGQYPLVAMPTGSGKTVVFCELIRRVMTGSADVSVLVMAHRKELIAQSEKKILEIWPDAPVGVMAASMKRRELERLTIASRDTLASVLDKNNYAPDLVVVDEAHRISPDDTTRYRKILAKLQARNERLMVVGFSATPYRAGDGYIYGEGKLFHSLAYEIKLPWLVNEGYLVPIRPIEVDKRAKIDTAKVPIVNGEFSQRKLAAVSEHPGLVVAAVADWHQRGYIQMQRKHTLFYCISIAHAEAVQKELKVYGIDAPLITGKTPQDERDDFIRRFMNREIVAAVNVEVFSEGTDLPPMDCIANLRAINSLGLWLQICGRVMRTDPGGDKEHGLMMDYGGCIERFGPIDIARPPERRGKKGAPRTKVCPSCQSIVGFFRTRCIAPCEHVFKPKVHKVCPNCKEPNDPSAGECPACGYLFVKHGTVASDGSLMSDGDQYKRVKVHSVSHRLLQSKRTGKEYLRVDYHTEAIALELHQVLALGHEGVAHEHAMHKWKSITRDDIDLPIPVTAAMAHQIAMNWQGNIWRAVDSLVYDQYHPYKKIHVIHYAENPANEPEPGRQARVGSNHSAPVRQGYY